MPASPSLDEIARCLDRLLEAPAYGAVRGRDGRGDQNGILRSSRRPVKRLAVALEPWPDLRQELSKGEIDALFLHRPWRLTLEEHAALEAGDVGVLAYHLAFDEHLTLGFNPPLAALLELGGQPEVFGVKEGRPLGMLGSLPNPVTTVGMIERVRRIFGGLETGHPGGTHQPEHPMITKIVVVGAMTDALVRQAHLQGAGLYVTGQWREPATVAARETKMAFAAVGHLRSEQWGLRLLADLLRARWRIEVVVRGI